MDVNKSRIDWSKIFQGSLEQLQSAPPEVLEVDLEHIVHELLRPDAPGVHCVPQSILGVQKSENNATENSASAAAASAHETGLQVLPEFQAKKLGDVVNQGLEFAQTSTTVGECLDNWAKAQRHLPNNSGVVHRSVVLHPVPMPNNGSFGSYGTYGASQDIAANSSEMARKQAAKVARAARVQKRRQEKFRRKGDALLDNNYVAQPSEPFLQSLQSGHLPFQSTQLVPQTNQGKAVAKDRNELRAIKNRESAARSRARRVEYTAALEAQVEKLREQNKTLRGRVIALAPAPPDPHAGKLEGRPLRRTRTMPL